MQLAIAAINTDETLLADYQLVGELYDTRCAVGPGISAVSSGLCFPLICVSVSLVLLCDFSLQFSVLLLCVLGLWRLQLSYPHVLFSTFRLRARTHWLSSVS